jgi:hypothetical protein
MVQGRTIIFNNFQIIENEGEMKTTYFVSPGSAKSG